MRASSSSRKRRSHCLAADSCARGREHKKSKRAHLPVPVLVLVIRKLYRYHPNTHTHTHAHTTHDTHVAPPAARVLQHREAAVEVLVTDLELGHVHAAEDVAGAHAHGLPGVARVDEAHDARSLRARLRHDRVLCTRVYERLERDPVHLHRDVSNEIRHIIRK